MNSTRACCTLTGPLFAVCALTLGCGRSQSDSLAYKEFSDAPAIATSADSTDVAATEGSAAAQDDKSPAGSSAKDRNSQQAASSATNDNPPQPAADGPKTGSATTIDNSTAANAVAKTTSSTSNGESAAELSVGSFGATGPVSLPSATQQQPSSGKKDASPRKVEVLVKERKFQVEGPQEAVRATYDDIDLLKVLNMDPVTVEAPKLMPDWLKALNGKRIRIRGFMYPPFEQTGIQAFVLARDNQICCFGRDPKIYDLMQVSLRDGVTTNYIQNRPFDVVGVFRIVPEAEDGKLYQLYQIDDAVVIDK